MAAFSYQYQPFLVDSSSCFSIINTSLPPHHFQIHQHQELPEPSFTNNQDQDQETSCVDQTSKFSITSDTTTDFSVVKNQSPESSMVVEKGEQVTQAMEKKRRNRNNIGSSLSSPCLSKDSTEGVGKKQKKNSGTGVKGEKEEKKKSSSSSTDDEEPPTDYIHVRARRGQATDSHSLAERVRREKISERMKVLQQLVPGCDRVTGKALVLDEIINYVQSLQNQVEFLSMKLASVNPIFFDMAIDLDTLLVTPDPKSNSIAPPCSNHATANFNFDDATTLMTTTTTTNSFPAANNDYLLDYSSSVFLQGQRSNNNFLEHTGGPFWDTEDQRQRFLNPYGFGNNTRSLN